MCAWCWAAHTSWGVVCECGCGWGFVLVQGTRTRESKTKTMRNRKKHSTTNHLPHPPGNKKKVAGRPRGTQKLELTGEGTRIADASPFSTLYVPKPPRPESLFFSLSLLLWRCARAPLHCGVEHLDNRCSFLFCPSSARMLMFSSVTSDRKVVEISPLQTHTSFSHSPLSFLLRTRHVV